MLNKQFAGLPWGQGWECREVKRMEAGEEEDGEIEGGQMGEGLTGE